MHEFRYVNGKLYCENVSIEALVKEHGTPLYVYSQKTLTHHFQALDGALAPLPHMVCYSVKANSNASVLRCLANLGSGFDVVSEGELRRVSGAGGDPRTCVFAGVGKTVAEIEYAMGQGIFAFTVESEAELERINRVAARQKVKAPVAIRVNPNVDAMTHPKITTGTYSNKFGIPFEEVEAVYARARKLKNVGLRGLHMHIGSQLTEVKPFEQAVRKVAPLVERLVPKYGLDFFSIGGGLGIVYESALASGDPAWWKTDAAKDILTAESFGAALVPLLKPLGLRILVEPGRFISGNAGILVTRVEYVKPIGSKNFIIVDAGMNDLIRPALYGAKHEIVPVVRKSGPEISSDVVGPVCETSDTFCSDRPLPKVGEGDFLAIMSTGAYGFSMTSTYNSRPLPAEVMVNGRLAALVRFRQYLPRIWEAEKLPRWLKFHRLPPTVD
ncbi:MAG: diaminopimelate decarboxylase [Candidatus Omnitrophica bacterium]|nr:diaminopimelate decarboxylase [Candidatus Omnitrophota bacterium]